MKHHRVIIVGGGPAGATCARYLVQSGVDCLVLDKQAFPRPKICAGWITPQVFRDLNHTPDDYPFPLTEFHFLKISINRFPMIKPGKQYAIRRIELDQWLLKKSQAPIIQHEVKEIQITDRGYLIDDLFSGEILVGAGGTHCPVYHRFFKVDQPRGEKIVALEEEYQTPTRGKNCRLWFFENGLPGYAWYVPKAGGYLNIGIGGNERILKERGSSIKNQWEFFLNKLKKNKMVAERDFHPQGYVYYLRSAKGLYRMGNAFLVGDAAGLATLDMGEGIGPAVRSGFLAARSIINGTDYSLESISKYSFLPFFLKWVVK